MAVKGRGSRRDSRNESYSDLSSQFERFSKSLDDHSKALNDFIVQFEKTTKSYSKGNTKDRDRTMEEGFSDISRSLDRSSVAQEKSLTTYQKVGKSIEVVIKNVGSMIRKELVTAYNGVKSSYTNHLSSITAQLNITNDQYRKLYNESSSYFKDQGLSKQFSPVDFAEALEGVLDTGLRGDLAKTTAYQNLMVNKLLPAVSVNTASMRRMTKTVGKGFSDNLLAFSKYTESALGAEGISEGKLNSMLDTLETNILYSSRGNSEQANASVNALEASISYLEKAGLDSSKFVDMMYSATTGQIGDSPVGQAILGMFSQSDIDKLMTDPKKIAQVTEDYVKFLASSGHDANLLQAKNAALGLDQDEAKRAVVFQDYGGNLDSIASDISELLEGYNKNSVLNSYKTQMESGQYQSADDALTKKEENFVTGIATATSTIARFDEVLSTVVDTLKSLAEIWLFSKAASSLGGSSGNTLKSLINGSSGSQGIKEFFGGSGSIFGNAKAAAELYNEGATFSEVSSVGGKGSAVLGKLGAKGTTVIGSKISGFGGASSLGGGLVNLAAGPGALIAGGAMIAADAIGAGKKIADAGGDFGDVTAAGFRAAITGRDTMTESEKANAADAALSGEKRKMDWGAVAKNAGKGALVGAGIGTATAGWAAGLGTVIGTGVGAVTGAVSSMIDQAIENAKYNKLADASTELSESMSALKDAQEKYNTVVTQGKSAQEMMNYITENRGSTDEEIVATSKEYFEALQELYPQQIGNLENVNDLDSKYIEIVNNKIDRENALASAEVAAQTANVASDMDEQWSRLNDITEGEIKSEAALAAAKEFNSKTEGENGKQLSAEETNDVLKNILKEYYGLSEGDERYEEQFQSLVKELNSGESGKILDVNDLGRVTGLKGQKGHGSTVGDNVVQYMNDYSESEKYINTIKSVIGNNTESLKTIWSGAQSLFVSLDEDQYDDKTATQPLRDTLNDFNSAVKSVIDNINKYPQAGLGYLKPKKENFENLDEIYESIGVTAPSFKVGLGTVPYDDYIANLHRGEMVLTAQQAQDYRDSSNVSAEVVGKIASQTESIVEILGNIFSLLSQTTRSHVTTSTIPSSVVSFQGV